ncbi:MAG: Eco47II family restriction endonuclease [Oscillospiraceae bacterium]|nr:Eco47II family restriction endonuclease [Oscillospiraceae bacterium]
MSWDISFITEEQFTAHVKLTIEKYGDKLKPVDLKKFNKNIVDPIKLIFDNSVYKNSWNETISNEIFRQRDKSNNNDIGYFHQRIFAYFDGCIVPENGQDGGWDVIFKSENGIALPDGTVVHSVYVEMKNKHNTMNSASAGKTFIKMQNQLLRDDDCACFLVEAIAKRSQNVKWETTVDGQNVGHKLIRRVSIDKFYEIVTGEKDAFYKVCLKLPEVIKRVVANTCNITPKDTVLDELKAIAESCSEKSEDAAMAMAVYMLGFSTYNGFNETEEK